MTPTTEKRAGVSSYRLILRHEGGMAGRGCSGSLYTHTSHFVHIRRIKAQAELLTSPLDDMTQTRCKNGVHASVGFGGSLHCIISFKVCLQSCNSFWKGRLPYVVSSLTKYFFHQRNVRMEDQALRPWSRSRVERVEKRAAGTNYYHQSAPCCPRLTS